MLCLLRIVVIAFFCLLCNVRSSQFVYPVAHFEDQDGGHLFMTKQLSLELLELYDVNPETGHYEKILSNRYLPAAVRLLPDNTGFSFVDNGRIKVKNFLKRSPRSVDFFEPVYGMEIIEWLDSRSGYFHAHSDNYMGIYEFTTEGDVMCLASSCSIDYMYPQIVGDNIWFVGRQQESSGYTSAIFQAIYEPGRAVGATQKILDFGCSRLLFLRMIAQDLGYVVVYDGASNCDDQLVHFDYYQIQKSQNSWSKQRLFGFDVPKQLLLGPQTRLYESLLPLIPCHDKESIFFCSYEAEYGRTAIYWYDIGSNVAKPVARSSIDLLVPVVHNGIALVGCAVDDMLSDKKPELVISEHSPMMIRAIYL